MKNIFELNFISADQSLAVVDFVFSMLFFSTHFLLSLAHYSLILVLYRFVAIELASIFPLEYSKFHMMEFFANNEQSFKIDFEQRKYENVAFAFNEYHCI